MTLNFQIRKEDLLAFSREYYASSVFYQKTRTRTRLLFPLIMLGLSLLSLYTDGFDYVRPSLYLTLAVLWFFFYPRVFDRRVKSYCKKFLKESSIEKYLGLCELTLTDSGLHSRATLGESTFYWTAVDRVILKETYLFIFVGSVGYPIPIADVGREAAEAAYDYAISHKAPLSEATS